MDSHSTILKDFTLDYEVEPWGKLEYDNPNSKEAGYCTTLNVLSCPFQQQKRIGHRIMYTSHRTSELHFE